ncbi:MAG: bifunctional 4-hydroxy-2-oxoglutarate aldolase/2-dehydro-3-deoxy-phosphogluconate aldolase [Oscillospiraceae bacterium]|jgi:2-dehydro-3-deoxyphosphogluconate aldolase/(4S)-4-hydroxy-2-oxoglutarate aldolase|nr:bifunctional 4-hydroxy-2-oxoglutarate aldolase/2-dehydro-3-deoxy-phosphogluconate aldolase [Oscillospiraceae bacterium]
MREQTIAKILEKKFIAIVRGISPAHICALAEALCAGGIPLIEVTFDQSRPDAFTETTEAIAALAAMGGEILPGAGTVMTPAQVRMAAEAGAKYIISPHADEAVIRETRRLGLVSLPGVMTPTECANAHTWGADLMKLFPAGVLGAEYLKALKAPLRHLHFLAVGGVSAANIPALIKAGAEGFGVGGNLVNRAWIEAGAFDKITAAAREIVEAIENA